MLDNDKLIQAAEKVLDSFNYHGFFASDYQVAVLLGQLNAALAEAKKPAEQQGEQEPAGYASPTMLRDINIRGSIPLASKGEAVLDGPEGTGEFDVPLYTHPDRVKAEPLTEAQVWASDEIMSVNSKAGLLMDTVLRFVRATEAAHGIGVQQEGE